MMKNKFNTSGVFMMLLTMTFSVPAFSDSKNISEINIDKKMDEFAELTDYYNAKTKMLQAKAQSEGVSESSEKERALDLKPGNKTNILGRDKRGISEYDQHESESKKSKAVAYVASTYGSSKLNAEIQWGEMSFIVAEGDPIIGGDWIVSSVSKSSVVLRSSRGSVRLTGSPVSIESLVGAQ